MIFFSLQFVQRDKDFWQQYEKFFGEKLPPCVVTILRECGYTLMSTLSDFKPENLAELEEHIHQQLRPVIENFKCCNAETYKKQQKFQFLPAHRNLIIGLPSKIQTMKERRRKKSNRIHTTHSVVMDTDDDIGTVPQNEIFEQIQNELLQKLQGFGRSQNYSTVEQMTLADITEVVFSFDDGQTVGHCQIKCPYCEKKYLTRYNKIWVTSNLNKHFREHETHRNVDNQVNDHDRASNNIDEISENLENGDEFNLGDDSNDNSLSKTIQLQIDALGSPENVSPAIKFARDVLQRAKLRERNHNEMDNPRNRRRKPKAGNKK